MIRYYWNRHIAWKSGESTSESEFVASRSVIINHVKTEKMKYFSIQCSPIYGEGAFWKVPRLRPFVLLVTKTCR